MSPHRHPFYSHPNFPYPEFIQKFCKIHNFQHFRIFSNITFSKNIQHLFKFLFSEFKPQNSNFFKSKYYAMWTNVAFYYYILVCAIAIFSRGLDILIFLNGAPTGGSKVRSWQNFLHEATIQQTCAIRLATTQLEGKPGSTLFYTTSTQRTSNQKILHNPRHSEKHPPTK